MSGHTEKEQYSDFKSTFSKIETGASCLQMTGALTSGDKSCLAAAHRFPQRLREAPMYFTTRVALTSVALTVRL